MVRKEGNKDVKPMVESMLSLLLCTVDLQLPFFRNTTVLLL